MSEQAQQALERTGGPQSTSLGVYDQAPNKNSAVTVVPLDRENLTFFANMIKNSGLVPSVKEVSADVSFNRVMAKIVAGTSYGFDPILAQSCFDVMFDQLGLNAKGQGILFKESGEYDLRIDSHDEKHCQVTVFRLRLDRTKWEPVGEVRFDEDMARAAGLLGKDLWKKYPRDMYFARVMTRVVKRFNPGCLRPKLILGNHFAKESQPTFNAPLPPPPAPPASLNAAPESTTTEEVPNGDVEHYVDSIDEPPIQGEAVLEAESAEVAGEVQMFTGPETETDTNARFEALGAIKTLLEIKVGTDPKKVTKFLGGIDLAQADAATLEKVRADLVAL